MNKNMSDDQSSHSLKAAFGEYVELQAEGDAPITYRILAELDVDGGRYAVLQSEEMRKEGDIEVLRIAVDRDGGIHLVSIESDDEWERAAEAYDDLQFGSDDRP